MTGLAAFTCEILRGPQHQHALDPHSVKMRKVFGVTGQQIVGLPMNSGRQDRLILRVEPYGLRQFETLRCVDGRDRLQQPPEPHYRSGSIHGQIPPGFFDRVGRTQQLGVVKAPEPADTGELQIGSGIKDVRVEEDPVQEEASGGLCSIRALEADDA